VLVGGPDKGRWLGPLTGMLKKVRFNPFGSSRGFFRLRYAGLFRGERGSADRAQDLDKAKGL